MKSIVQETQYGTSTKSNTEGKGLPILRMNNITYAGELDLSSIKWCLIPESNKSKYTTKRGDLLFNRTNSPELVGKTGIWESDEEYLIAGYLVRVRFKRDRAIPEYVSAYLNSPFGKKYLYEKAKPSNNMSNFSASEFLRIPIPLPTLDKQKRISDILNKTNLIRRKRKEAIALTEELLRSTFLDMFGDPVTNPQGWDKCKLSKLGCVVTGNTPPRANLENYGDDIEWIKSDNITTPYHFLTYATEGLSSQGKKIARIVPPNSILVACIAGSRSSIGRAALADREVAFNQQINAIVPNPNVDPYFLYTQFFVAQHLVQAQSTDSMKGLVSKSKFSNIEFIRPPEQKQREFGKWFLKFHTWSGSLRDGEQYTDNLFNSLLQKAFRGEL